MTQGQTDGDDRLLRRTHEAVHDIINIFVRIDTHVSAMRRHCGAAEIDTAYLLAQLDHIYRDLRSGSALARGCWTEIKPALSLAAGLGQQPAAAGIFGTTRAQEAAPVVERAPPRRALVVDDQAVQREITADMLHELGWTVEMAGDGQEALERCIATRYGLILLDYRLPVLDGPAVARRLRQEGSALSARTPIIGLTASPDPAYGESGIEAGMNRYLTKPLRLETLRGAIDAVMPNSTLSDSG